MLIHNSLKLKSTTTSKAGSCTPLGGKQQPGLPNSTVARRMYYKTIAPQPMLSENVTGKIDTLNNEKPTNLCFPAKATARKKYHTQGVEQFGSACCMAQLCCTPQSKIVRSR
jgi:hypothetical protein